MKERSLCDLSRLILLSGILFLVPGIVTANSELSTIVGVYEGEIESNIMVQASTEFYLDASSRLMGRYRYQDQGGWDQGDIFNVRISKQCGTNLDPVGGSSTNNSSGSNSGSLTGFAETEKLAVVNALIEGISQVLGISVAAKDELRSEFTEVIKEEGD
jgi:hypothetical protein